MMLSRLSANLQHACQIPVAGHHAERAEGTGFCVFNNIAVVAAAARATYGLERICVVDYDVHHGNGTQVTVCIIFTLL